MFSSQIPQAQAGFLREAGFFIAGDRRKERSMQTCQDNYSTVFASFGEMHTYHRRLSQESQWRRCRVRDLTIEPLDSKSPLAEDLPAFAPGTSQEAVRDTVRGLGLAMRVEGNLYPMRDTAYKSLLDRAKLRGSVLPKLSRPKLARTLTFRWEEYDLAKGVEY